MIYLIYVKGLVQVLRAWSGNALPNRHNDTAPQRTAASGEGVELEATPSRVPGLRYAIEALAIGVVGESDVIQAVVAQIYVKSAHLFDHRRICEPSGSQAPPFLSARCKSGGL